jgi:hypothetical protein
MTKLDATDADQPIDEAVAYVRNVLAAADSGHRTEISAHDERGRADFYRILNSEEPAKRRRRHRRWMVVAATALSLACATAAADATGLIPTGVVQHLRKGSDGNLHAYAGKARMRAETRTSDGDVVQYWDAPNRSGGRCTYLRVLPHGGKEEKGGGGVGCAMPDDTPDKDKTPWDRVAFFTWEPAIGDRMVAYGNIEPRLKTATLRVTLTDGRRLTIPVKADGYFIGLLPAGVNIQKTPAEVEAQGRAASEAWMRTHPGLQMRTVEALSADGRVLVTDDLDPDWQD